MIHIIPALLESRKHKRGWGAGGPGQVTQRSQSVQVFTQARDYYAGITLTHYRRPSKARECGIAYGQAVVKYSVRKIFLDP